MNDTDRSAGAAGALKRLWQDSPLFSTGVALLVMVVLQTAALGFDYASPGAWLWAWFNNWLNILRNNAVIGIIALGMTLVIISGGIDLAVGATMVGVGNIMMVIMEPAATGLLYPLGITGLPAMLIALAACLASGVAIGSLIGVTVTKGRVPPFIATLGAMNIIRSVAQQAMTGRIAPKVPAEFMQLSNAVIGGLRFLPILYWLIAAVALYVVSRHTAFGRYVYAVGSNERTTRLSGISVDAVKMKVYGLMGLIVSVAAIVETARMGSMNTSNAGTGYELDAIAAVVVGGTSMAGGRGSIAGTVMGMLIIAVMNNLLNLIGVPSFLRNAFKGAIVVAAVLIQRKERADG
ncbi:MAG: ABC transporter permease [Clostridiales bacterium]|nr:ABC transporter permease [Clostridiales bacterium]